MNQETRNGAFVYDEAPGKFHEWEFRTMVKWQSSEEHKRLQSLSTIVDGLRGEAARIAMDIGHATLLREDGSGVIRLVEISRSSFAPKPRRRRKSCTSLAIRRMAPCQGKQQSQW